MITPVVDAIEEVGALVDEYEQFLSGKAQGTREAYLRTARQVIGWVAKLPGNAGQFQPQQLTQTAVELYLAHLEQEGLSLCHRARVKSTISNFAQFLIEEKRLLRRNPTRGIELPTPPLPTPQPLSQEQRLILCSLVTQEGDRRGAALFALGYWAGCRASELCWLKMDHTHVSPKEGWIHVGYKESKERDIDLLNSAHMALYAYLQATDDLARTYVFRSRRGEHLTEEGIHCWFRTLRVGATTDQREVIADLTFQDLRYDFACRAREAGWSSEEVAYYLGCVPKNGMSALQTTIRSTYVSRKHIKEKLENIQG